MGDKHGSQGPKADSLDPEGAAEGDRREGQLHVDHEAGGVPQKRNEEPRGAPSRDPSKQRWTLEGYDTFDNDTYPLEGEYFSENEAIGAAEKRLQHLDQSQPPRSSGGQGWGGIQDRVYIVCPDGRKYRYTGGR